MKTPKLIYTYWQSKHDAANCIIHELRVYEPRMYGDKTPIRLGDELFGIRGQSNLDSDHNRGLRRAYALRFENLPVERPSAVKLAAKLSAAACSQDNGFPQIIKALRKMGAVRFAIGQVDDPKSYSGREFMPRKFAGKKSAAYWDAIKAGLTIE